MTYSYKQTKLIFATTIERKKRTIFLSPFLSVPTDKTKQAVGYLEKRKRKNNNRETS